MFLFGSGHELVEDRRSTLKRIKTRRPRDDARPLFASRPHCPAETSVKLVVPDVEHALPRLCPAVRYPLDPIVQAHVGLPEIAASHRPCPLSSLPRRKTICSESLMGQIYSLTATSDDDSVKDRSSLLSLVLLVCRISFFFENAVDERLIYTVGRFPPRVSSSRRRDTMTTTRYVRRIRLGRSAVRSLPPSHQDADHRLPARTDTAREHAAQRAHGSARNVDGVLTSK